MQYWEEYYVLYNRYLNLYNSHGILRQSQEGLSRFLIAAFVSVVMECIYSGKMTLKSTMKVCKLIENNVDLQNAAKACARKLGKTSRYANWIVKNRGQLVAIEMWIRSFSKKMLK